MSDRIRSVQESALRQSLIEVVAKALALGDEPEYGDELNAAAVVDALGVEHVEAYWGTKLTPLYRIKALES